MFVRSFIHSYIYYFNLPSGHSFIHLLKSTFSVSIRFILSLKNYSITIIIIIISIIIIIVVVVVTAIAIVVIAIVSVSVIVIVITIDEPA